MAKSNPSTILLKGDPMPLEYLADGAITPGHLVKLDSDGKVTVHATAGAYTPVYIAREHETDGGDIDEAYAAADTCFIYHCKPGDEVYVLLPASAAAVVIGDLLESAGDGTFRKVAAALTDNSGGTANTTLQAIGGSYTEAEVENNFADVALAINTYKAGSTALLQALEAIDNSGGGSAARIKARVIR